MFLHLVALFGEVQKTISKMISFKNIQKYSRKIGTISKISTSSIIFGPSYEWWILRVTYLELKFENQIFKGKFWKSNLNRKILNLYFLCSHWLIYCDMRHIWFIRCDKMCVTWDTSWAWRHSNANDTSNCHLKWLSPTSKAMNVTRLLN